MCNDLSVSAAISGSSNGGDGAAAEATNSAEAAPDEAPTTARLSSVSSLGRLRSDTSNATIEENISLANGVPAMAKSCLVRGASGRGGSLIKKHVNYSESAEMIPLDNLSDATSPLADDDEVFSDSIDPQLPRGDMCAPYLKKRGSMPGLVALPDWFGLEQFREEGGVLEPPVTPVGRDELAMKRHRLFSEILQAAQAAAEHRVRFNPWGPSVTAAAGGVQQDQLMGNA